MGNCVGVGSRVAVGTGVGLGLGVGLGEVGTRVGTIVQVGRTALSRRRRGRRNRLAAPRR